MTDKDVRREIEAIEGTAVSVAETLFEALPAHGSLTIRRAEHGLVFRWDERLSDKHVADLLRKIHAPHGQGPTGKSE